MPRSRALRSSWALRAALPAPPWATARAAATSSGSTRTSLTRSGAKRCSVSAGPKWGQPWGRVVSQVSPSPGRRRSCAARMPSRPSPTSASEGGGSTPRPAASPAQGPQLRSETPFASLPLSRDWGPEDPSPDPYVGGARLGYSIPVVGREPLPGLEAHRSAPRTVFVRDVPPPPREGSSVATCRPPHPGLPCAPSARSQRPRPRGPKPSPKTGL